MLRLISLKIARPSYEEREASENHTIKILVHSGILSHNIPLTSQTRYSLRSGPDLTGEVIRPKIIYNGQYLYQKDSDIVSLFYINCNTRTCFNRTTWFNLYRYGDGLPLTVYQPIGSVAQWISHLTNKWKVVGPNPTVPRSFHFVILAWFEFLAAWLSQYKWNQPWHTLSQLITCFS